MKKRFLILCLLIITVNLSFVKAQDFVHPGILHTQADFDRVKEKIGEGKEPWVSAYAKLTSNSFSQLTYNPSPTEYIIRGGSSGENYANAMRDAAAAYQCGLRWKISGDNRYADKAVQILNAWASKCIGIGGDTNASLASGIYGYEFANAAELIRDYEGWEREDFKKYQRFMLSVFYTGNVYFLKLRHGTCAGHYWSNWGLCNVMSMISIGILCDDPFIYNEGISYYKLESGRAESLNSLVWKLHEDARGPFGYFGQMQESNRDQGHALMAVGLASDICEVAWNQGENLYAYDNNRIVAGIEYVAAYNSGINDLPNSPFTRYYGANCASEVYSQMGEGGRGANRPIWARIVNHYENRMGIEVTYSSIMGAQVGVEGGGGHYGSTSGGFDHLGFGTLMNTLDAFVDGQAPTVLSSKIVYNGTEFNKSEYNNVTKGSLIKFVPVLPDDETDTGLWKWSNGSTSKDLEFSIQESGIYRVVYTNAKGVDSSQYFSIGVRGDCNSEAVTPVITIDGVDYKDTILTVMPRTKLVLSVNATNSRFGSFKWMNNSTESSLTIPSISSPMTVSVVFTSECGFEHKVNFHIKISHVSAALRINGGDKEKTNTALLKSGGSVELTPEVYKTGGTWLWSDGSTNSTLLLENIDDSKDYSVTYTYEGTAYSLDYRVNAYVSKQQITGGDYYIIDAQKKTYLTNNGTTVPVFISQKTQDEESQIWSISKDGARYKILSKDDGRYVNENGVFGTNPYYTDWNTYDFHWIVNSNYYAIQNGGLSGVKYWRIDGSSIYGKADDSLLGFPFEIRPVNSSSIEIDNEISSKIKIYPNPVEDYLIVNASQEAEDVSVFSLFSMNGLLIKSMKCVAGENTINLSECLPGVYIGTYISKSVKETFKILKK